ncbi:phosphatidylinositol N-acetylglucosaminyltransferase subunit Y-like [Nycticebus coucang]|uniref:phosphatidylinositol N-acetylglucosaminyltransferase subunit Y-like n=1 Tax=Nycticebus coucang TaxID=9470 RepID=UPI00234D6889|nr:phosphatidylinositol N-acetylglucosaminyltransferase subunit Y-like [Nycticebus coucang]
MTCQRWGVISGGEECLSLPTLTVLIPLITVAGLFYSASVEENFPHGCTSPASLYFDSLLLPITLPAYMFFHLWTWMVIKLFWHN